MEGRSFGSIIQQLRHISTKSGGAFGGISGTKHSSRRCVAISPRLAISAWGSMPLVMISHTCNRKREIEFRIVTFRSCCVVADQNTERKDIALGRVLVRSDTLRRHPANRTLHERFNLRNLVPIQRRVPAHLKRDDLLVCLHIRSLFGHSKIADLN
jgi:hypothetical protein